MAQSHGHRSDDEREKRKLDSWHPAHPWHEQVDASRRNQASACVASCQLWDPSSLNNKTKMKVAHSGRNVDLWVSHGTFLFNVKNLVFAVRRRSGSLKFNIKRAFSPKRHCPDLAGQVEMEYYLVEKHISSLFNLNIIWIWKSLGNVF